jgi:hypothetical protein
MMKNRKRIIIPIAVMLIIGGSLTSNNELENARLIDIVQLIVIGMLLGILIANLKTIFWNKK